MWWREKVMKSGKSSGVRILVNEYGNNQTLTEDIHKYIRKGKLEQLISIQDEEDLIDIYVLEKKQTIRQLLIMVSDDEDQIVVCLDGKFPLKMIQEAIASEDGVPMKKIAKKR